MIISFCYVCLAFWENPYEISMQRGYKLRHLEKTTWKWEKGGKKLRWSGWKTQGESSPSRYTKKIQKLSSGNIPLAPLMFMLSVSTLVKVCKPALHAFISPVLDNKWFNCLFQFSIKTITLRRISFCSLLDIVGVSWFCPSSMLNAFLVTRGLKCTLCYLCTFSPSF